MEFLEKDLEEILFNSDKELLKQRGLNINGKLFRQLRIGNYGIADIVEFKKDTVVINGEFRSHQLYVTVYELKKDKIGISSFLQAIRYLKGIKSFLNRKGFYNVDYSISLIGKRIDMESSFIYITDFLSNENGCEFLSNYTYSYSADGIYFKDHCGYKLIDEGFGK